jgi:lipopolysaccharide/colanic/teichoic acid biosynthesis glycosyltransferase/glycosyltransferase involved in cell wall biosynthesis
MRVALVHDWLTGMRGGERVLAELCSLFPEATLFTLFRRPGSVGTAIEARAIRTSFLNAVPGIHRHYRWLLPLLPLAASRLDLRGYDLIVSSSHAAAKGARKPSGSLHICYCHTPMRYIWDAEQDYFHYGDPLGVRRAALRLLVPPLRAWDRASAARVDHFIANSRNVQERIARHYGRSSEVIHPPVDTGFFTPDGDMGGDFYLIASALVPPKRIDLAIDAFNRLGRILVIAGQGPDADALRRRAGPTIRFTGFVSDEQLRDLYRRCRALVVPGREDFGMTAVEAQACGRPVIAYAAGGALESVTDGETGIFFSTQSPACLESAVMRLESTRFERDRLRAAAERFSADRFRSEFMGAVERATRSAAWRPRTGSGRGTAHASVAGLSGLVKRTFDAALSLAGLLVLALPLALLAALVRLGSPGSAFFRQRRVGLYGREFTIVKLRTMTADAEWERGPTWAVADDPRCTPLGGFLRRYGLDEMPQLWNVLRGDMSLVGPRPERPEFLERFADQIPGFHRRLAVRPGMTGLAQVQGWRGDTSLAARLRADLDYIARWSLWRDAAILLRTPLALLRPPRT